MRSINILVASFSLLLAAGAVGIAAIPAEAQALVAGEANITRRIESAEKSGKLSLDNSTAMRLKATEISNRELRLRQENHGVLEFADRKELKKELAILQRQMGKVESARGSN